MHNQQLLPKFLITYLTLKKYDTDIDNLCGHKKKFKK
jgi:hypothetical protein